MWGLGENKETGSSVGTQIVISLRSCDLKYLNMQKNSKISRMKMRSWVNFI